MSNQSQFPTSFQPDLPLIIDALYRSTNADRSYIDSQVRGLQQVLGGVIGGSVPISQSITVATQNATGVLTFAQLQSTSVESSGNASGTVTITGSVVIPGMEWTFRNNNTGTSTTTFMGVTVAIGKSAIVRINSAGAGERVTADT